MVQKIYKFQVFIDGTEHNKGMNEDFKYVLISTLS
jgi:hypothetical protein